MLELKPPAWGCKRLWCPYYGCYACCASCAAVRCDTKCCNNPDKCGQVVKDGSEVEKYFGHWEG